MPTRRLLTITIHQRSRDSMSRHFTQENHPPAPCSNGPQGGLVLTS